LSEAPCPRQLAVYISNLAPAQAAELDTSAADDFQLRFAELQKEFDRLRQQLEALKGTAKKPSTDD
jgi:hypothetical protein